MELPKGWVWSISGRRAVRQMKLSTLAVTEDSTNCWSAVRDTSYSNSRMLLHDDDTIQYFSTVDMAIQAVELFYVRELMAEIRALQEINNATS